MLEQTEKNFDRTIPFLNLKELIVPIREEIDQALRSVVDSSHFIGGPAVKSFEESFAEWISKDCSAVGCGNGTDAITLAARGLSLPPGSEAIVPAMTFYATVGGLLSAGIKVKIVDVEPETWLMDPKQLENAITENTKLIVPVHLYGQMASMDEIKTIADKHHCRILEDSAQAHGALWKDKPPSHWGDVATYSFYPGKNLGAFGDAGAIVSKDAQVLQQCRALGNQGALKKYQHEYKGFNSRLDHLQAAILEVKLKHLTEWNNARRQVAKHYHEALSKIGGLTLPKVKEHSHHVYHLFVVLVEDRSHFMQFLSERGVGVGIHYPSALHQLDALKEEFGSSSFPQAERVAAHGVSLPMCPTLSFSDIEYVSDVVRSYFKSHG